MDSVQKAVSRILSRAIQNEAENYSIVTRFTGVGFNFYFFLVFYQFFISFSLFFAFLVAMPGKGKSGGGGKGSKKSKNRAPRRVLEPFGDDPLNSEEELEQDLPNPFGKNIFYYFTMFKVIYF